MDEDKEKDAAIMIAEAINNTPTERRGFLLLTVANELEKKTQFFTATCIRMIADKYNNA